MRTVVAVLLLGAAALLAARPVFDAAHALHPLGAGPSPYGTLEHFALLRILAPLTWLGLFVAFLAPGWLLVLSRGRRFGVLEALLLGFGVDLVLVLVASTVGKLAFGAPLPAWGLATIWGLMTAAAGADLLMRRARAPAPTHADVRRLVSMAVAVLVGAALVVPKLYWEDFNSDGMEAFEFGRSLSQHYLPHWELREGTFGLYHNYALFSLPNHWFITFVGPAEAATRGPFLLYIGLVFVGVVHLAERGLRELRLSEELLVWGALAVYAVVHLWSSPSEPHYADLGEHGAVDTLWVVCFLGVLAAFFGRRRGFLVLFCVLTHASSAGGAPLVAALFAMALVFGGPALRPQVKALGVGLIAIGAVVLAHRFVYRPLVIGDVKSQFSPRNLASRLAEPHLAVWARWNALLFPSGLLPAGALALARPADPIAFCVAGVTLGFFALVYVQSWALTHQFSPVMVLPLIVFWRLYLARPARQAVLRPAAALGIAIAFVASLPQDFSVMQQSRRLGEVTRVTLGDYTEDYRGLVRGAPALWSIVEEDYRVGYPDHQWGTDPHVWLYYATRPGPKSPVDFALVPPPSPAPAGLEPLAEGDGWRLYARPGAPARVRHQRFPQVTVSPLYEPILRQVFGFYQEMMRRDGATIPTRGDPSAP